MNSMLISVTSNVGILDSQGVVNCRIYSVYPFLSFVVVCKTQICWPVSTFSYQSVQKFNKPDSSRKYQSTRWCEWEVLSEFLRFHISLSPPRALTHLYFPSPRLSPNLKGEVQSCTWQPLSFYKKQNKKLIKIFKLVILFPQRKWTALIVF